MTRPQDIIPLEDANADQLKAYEVAKEWIVSLKEAGYAKDVHLFVYASKDPDDIVIYCPESGESVIYLAEFFLPRSMVPGMLGSRQNRFLDTMCQLVRHEPAKNTEIGETTPLREYPGIIRDMQNDINDLRYQVSALIQEQNRLTNAQKKPDPASCKLCDGTLVVKDYLGVKMSCPRCT